MHHTQKTFIYISITIIFLAVAVGLLITKNTAKAPETGTPTIGKTTDTNSETVVPQESLGAQISADAQNPIENKIPSVAPDTNPIKDAYQNPFQ